MRRASAMAAMRLHALIFAAGQGVPLVGVVYDPKVSSFLDDLGQPRYAPLRDVTEPLLTGMIEDALAGGQRAADASARLRALARENCDAARELLEETK